MKKSFYLLGAVAITLASCADDGLLENSVAGFTKSETGEITFSYVKEGMTRANATGAVAANAIGRQFNVYGVKNVGSNTYKQVFNDYSVWYSGATAGSSEENSKGWEYVGTVASFTVQKDEFSADITRQTTVKGNNQSIKYWDYSSSEYWFYAVSSANVTTSGSEKENYKWYIGETEATTASEGKISKCVIANVSEDNSVYYADAVKRAKGSTDGWGYATHPANEQTSANPEVVTFNFKTLQSKVRIGFYETVPGYAVNDVKFYPAANLTASSAVGFNGTSNDAVTIVSNTTADTDSKISKGFMPTSNTEYTITYDVTSGVATLKNTTSSLAMASSKTFGKLNYTNAKILLGENSGSEAKYLGETSTTPTWATHDGAATASSPYAGAAGNNYWYVLPNEDANQYDAFKIKVDYTLTSIDGSKETIKVTGAEAVVPVVYCQWKGNYAYTYLFKISDNTNGTTGTATTDPKGLYPITFDACVVEFADGTQGTTTEISDYAITTYQDGSVTNKGIIYKASTAIDVTILDNTGKAAEIGQSSNPSSVWYVYTSSASEISTKATPSLTNGTFTIAGSDVKAGVYAISYKWHDGTKYVVTTKYVKVGAAGSVADESAVNDIADGTLVNTNNTFTLPVGATFVKAYAAGATTSEANLSSSSSVYSITNDVDVYYNLGKTQYKATVNYYTYSLNQASVTKPTSDTPVTSDITFKHGENDVASPSYKVYDSNGAEVTANITISSNKISVTKDAAAATYTIKATATNVEMTTSLTVN